MTVSLYYCGFAPFTLAWDSYVLPDQSGDVDYTFSLAGHAGGDALHVPTFTVIAGTLPSGVSMDSTGQFSGGAGDTLGGTFTFTVRASCNGLRVDKTFTVQIFGDT